MVRLHLLAGSLETEPSHRRVAPKEFVAGELAAAAAAVSAAAAAVSAAAAAAAAEAARR